VRRNLARVIRKRAPSLYPILEVAWEVSFGNEVDLPQVVIDFRISADELGRESQEVLASVWNYRALAELEVDVGVFGVRISDNTDKSFTCNGVDSVFVLLQYFFEEVVVDILPARIQGWIDVEALVDSHCINPSNDQLLMKCCGKGTFIAYCSCLRICGIVVLGDDDSNEVSVN
jgi:hypothetical protein